MLTNQPPEKTLNISSRNVHQHEHDNAQQERNTDKHPQYESRPDTTMHHTTHKVMHCVQQVQSEPSIPEKLMPVAALLVELRFSETDSRICAQAKISMGRICLTESQSRSEHPPWCFFEFYLCHITDIPLPSRWQATGRLTQTIETNCPQRFVSVWLFPSSTVKEIHHDISFMFLESLLDSNFRYEYKL